MSAGYKDEINRALSKKKTEALKNVEYEKLKPTIINKVTVDITAKYPGMKSERLRVYTSLHEEFKRFPVETVKTSVKTEYPNLPAQIDIANTCFKYLFASNTYTAQCVTMEDNEMQYYTNFATVANSFPGTAYAGDPRAAAILLLDVAMSMYIQKKAMMNIAKAKGYKDRDVNQMYDFATEKSVTTESTKKYKNKLNFDDVSLLTKEVGSSTEPKQKVPKMSKLGLTGIYFTLTSDLGVIFDADLRCGMASFLKAKAIPSAILSGPTYFFLDRLTKAKTFVGNFTFSKSVVKLSITKTTPNIADKGLRGKMALFMTPDTDGFFQQMYNSMLESKGLTHRLNIAEFRQSKTSKVNLAKINNTIPSQPTQPVQPVQPVQPIQSPAGYVVPDNLKAMALNQLAALAQKSNESDQVALAKISAMVQKGQPLDANIVETLRKNRMSGWV